MSPPASMPQELLHFRNFGVRHIEIFLCVHQVVRFQGGISFRQVHLHAFDRCCDVSAEPVSVSFLLMLQRVHAVRGRSRPRVQLVCQVVHLCDFLR